MSKPIIDKAEVSIDFPDKFYHGTFSRSSRYDVLLDDQGIHITLRTQRMSPIPAEEDREEGEKRHIAFHLQHHLFSDILGAMADQVATTKLSDIHREQLADAVKKLAEALK